jgi:16S rRNA processing protein RimM
VARIVGVFGVRGEVKLAAPDGAALRAGLGVVVEPVGGGDAQHAQIESVRAHGRGFVARLREVDNVEMARSLQGALVFADRAGLPELAENEYREVDLVGMRVIDAKLGTLGDVREVRRYPSCDMLVIGEKKMLVPMLRAYGLAVDAAKAEIRVTLPDGFEEII